MSQVRRQSIISTIFVYTGFLIGFVNTWLFTRQESPFSPSEYGITQIFIAVGSLMFAFSNFGMVSVVYKFYPYYNDNLPKKKNDLLTWSMVVSLLGFLLVCIFGYIFRDVVIRKFGANSPLFLKYYFWIFPFGLGLLLFSMMEVFAWNIRKSILTTFLREVMVKLLTMVFIFFVSFKWITTFDGFIILYSLIYGMIAFILMVYLIWKKEFHLTFKFSRVTKKFYKKMASMAGLVYLGSTILMISTFIDTIIIMSLVGTSAAGIFSLGSVVSGLVQAPQRGVIAASIPVLSKAWKDKNMDKISLIYKRSGINLLIISLGIFLLVWMSYEDAVETFNLKTAYLDSKWIFFFLGMARIVDSGTGVNSQIIGTSIFWRFEMVSGVVLLVLIVPLNYYMIKEFGIVGAGYSNLISLSIYNVIRLEFLSRRFKMHPFSMKTLYAILIALACYSICHYLFHSYHGLSGMFLRSSIFIALYGGAIVYFDLTPDILPVWETLKKRARILNKESQQTKK